MKLRVAMFMLCCTQTAASSQNTLDEENKRWIEEFKKPFQSQNFIEQMAQDEGLKTLLQQESTPENNFLGSDSVQAVLDEAKANTAGAAADTYVQRMGSPEGTLAQEQKRLQERIDHQKASTVDPEKEALNVAIGAALQEQFAKGPKITVDPKEPMIQVAQEVQKALMKDGAIHHLPIPAQGYEERTCEEDAHAFTKTVIENLEIQTLMPVRTQAVSLYAAAHNESFVTIFADLKTGTIRAAGNGSNQLHPDSAVKMPLGVVEGRKITLTRTSPDRYWQVESPEAIPYITRTFSADPNSDNQFQFSFNLQQRDEKRYKAQYRGMEHHWQAKIEGPLQINKEFWKGAEGFHARPSCTVVANRCLSTPETKIFQEQGLELAVHRDCWKRETTFQCGTQENKVTSNCKTYREQGCLQIESECLKLHQEKCSLYRQHFQCPIHRESIDTTLDVDLTEFQDPALALPFQGNEGFGQVTAALSFASQLAKEEVSQEGSADLQKDFHFFNGNHEECQFSPRKCCYRKGKNFITTIAGCSEGEHALRPKVANGLCQPLNNSRKKKLVGKRYQHYCCFNSKMARVAQVGARAQLGVGFGNSAEPNCRGLSIDELQRVDWAKVDFSEVAQEFIQKAQKSSLDKGLQQSIIKAFVGHQAQENNQLSHTIEQRIEVLERGSLLKEFKGNE